VLLFVWERRLDLAVKRSSNWKFKIKKKLVTTKYNLKNLNFGQTRYVRKDILPHRIPELSYLEHFPVRAPTRNPRDLPCIWWMMTTTSPIIVVCCFCSLIFLKLGSQYQYNMMHSGYKIKPANSKWSRVKYPQWNKFCLYVRQSLEKIIYNYN
jgi:hypothetical protein